MSYILSALRKAELERHGDNTCEPAKGDWSTSYKNAEWQKDKKPFWLIPAILILIVATGFTMLFDSIASNGVSSQTQHVGLTTDPDISSMVTAETSVQSASTSSVIDSASQSNEMNLSQNKLSVFNNTSATQVDSASKLLSEQHEQPLPPFTITGYIYFEDNPGASEVLIDGIVYRLGSAILKGVSIREFHPNALVVSYRGKLHEISTNQ